MIMAMVLPAGIAFMVASWSQSFHVEGFLTASLTVVEIMITGVIIAAFFRIYDPYKALPRE